MPFAAFPLSGVLTHQQVAAAYGHTVILLLMGGFILSTAVEKCGAHRRIALAMIRTTGLSRRRIVLGFMIASATCSMWISNTATTIMLLPVAVAVVHNDQTLETPLLLGIAYAASIGGMGTPIGTPPNAIFMAVFEQQTRSTVSFIDWMTIGVPIVCVMVPLTWIYLTRRIPQGQVPFEAQASSWSSAEVRVSLVFAITAAAWIFRTTPVGGWTGVFGVPGVGDSTIALAAVVVLFLLPNGKGGQLLDWDTAKAIPWGLLLLFGGGLAISSAFENSGLSTSLGTALSAMTTWPTIALIIVLCVGVTFLTEVTSNTATTSLLMPVLAATALQAQIDPKLLMIPAALSASCAFMLPVATAPNAIVVGSGRVATLRMARVGLALNFVGVAVIASFSSLLL